MRGDPSSVIGARIPFQMVKQRLLRRVTFHGCFTGCAGELPCWQGACRQYSGPAQQFHCCFNAVSSCFTAVQDCWHCWRRSCHRLMPVVMRAVSTLFQRRLTMPDRCARLLALLAKTLPSFDASSPADFNAVSTVSALCRAIGVLVDLPLIDAQQFHCWFKPFHRCAGLLVCSRILLAGA